MTHVFPAHPFGHSIRREQLAKIFSACHSREEKYRQLVILSRQLPALPPENRTGDTEIKGCENRVWLDGVRNNDGTLHFWGDSDGRIVKGLLAVLLTEIEGLTPAELLSLDLPVIFEQYKLSDQLSQSRRNGIAALIDAARIIAQKFSD
ncbi:cysteine desulfurase sulfur acceptor subunit CsdE [Morganella psychrotolerans]|uniref:Cysteine desulfurase sulfur acceptor subunit CsdE n=1 Tax=Morganella psychrotolerans TaxID=368603 RepID=A0A5M9R0A3_9GAMM|nr:cysteine desulfurase sulfur acceptor subunit CsdE [Morganella psychrotolerans]KAA8714008.1 cysteine desulfurase sulfur acceptor subunit CsdE [Morganella psychrotolerans]OBU06643.1 cysteine desulfurase, sulfur acceptor subunit CsdE [Morganella psychrotolerans]